MSTDFYFFDQDARSSHLGGVQRTKKNSKDYHQALQDQKRALSFENESHEDTPEEFASQVIFPDILTKELDSILQTYDPHADTHSSASERSQSPATDQGSAQLPKVSLPASLILQLNSTWSDLIENTNYQYKPWRTKAAEHSWKQFVQRKRSEHFHPAKFPETTENKLLNRRRTSSRVSMTSISNLSHRQSVSTTDPKSRLSRALSRSSIFSTTHLLQENSRLWKILNPTAAEHANEPVIKNGIHLEFKFSSQDHQIQQKIASFDVPKFKGNMEEDSILQVQNHCKRLLAEMKQKMSVDNQTPIPISCFLISRLETTSGERLPKIWFYEDNQFVRKKNSLLSSNDHHRKQKSKFVLSIFRGEIPEKFQFDWNFPENKHKCYIELSDGSTQIYYPSGRLAVLRLSSAHSTTIFYDDSPQNTFLGLVNSHGNVLLMNPSYHARFLSNHQKECAYLCDSKSGLIQKEFSTNQTNENLFQFQLNSFMQIQYENSANINFVFKHEHHLFEYQLGKSLTTFQNVTSTILTTKRISSNVKRSNSILLHQLDKQLLFNQKLTPLEELDLFKKRIKQICHSWLKSCRSVLGILNINAYHLPDYPFPSTKVNDQLVRSLDTAQVLVKKNTPSNAIANAIEQFVPHSDTGRAMKQRIYEKKLLQNSLSMIK